MKTSDFYYALPEELIAQTPLKDRSSSRLMVLNKQTGEIAHRIFTDVLDYLNEGDCLVFNNTKVLPARLMGKREKTGGRVEVLVLSKRAGDSWEVLVKPGRKARIGERIVFGAGFSGAVTAILDEGIRLMHFTYDGIFEEALYRLGQIPLPPYIKKSLTDQNRYQTVYAKHSGSAAAPTAGLHFTQELLDEIDRRGIVRAEVTLHVGLGTFRPVKVDDVKTHQMHAEHYALSVVQANKINKAKANGGRIICVGTTAVRTIETCAQQGYVTPGSGLTQIFIYPGYQFQMTDAMITNFHLPESTLIMLTAAFAGKTAILEAYNQAVLSRYRFFSFGDAMFIG